MALALPPHVHLAVLGDDVVLLDVAADAYLCIPEGRLALRPSADRARLDPMDEDLVLQLKAAGLIGDAAAPRRAPCLRPTRDIGPLACGRPTFREVLRLAAALWDVVRHYRGRAFPEILAFVALSAEAPVARDASPEAVLRLARLFQTWAVWLPMPRKCLVRSFVLLRFLQRSGVTATWVFGVSTWPFAAHCWLQVDDIALDDAWDRLAAYEPILAVG